MSERVFRIIMGLCLLIGLYFRSMEVLYGLIFILLFEGVTNLRIPLLISRLRYGEDRKVEMPAGCECSYSFEAERALRFVVIAMVYVSTLPIIDVIWWFPWFLGFALIGAGLSGICPIVLTLRWIGFK